MPKIQVFLFRRSHGVYYKTEGVVPAKHLQFVSNSVSKLVDHLSSAPGSWSQISVAFDSEEVDTTDTGELAAQDVGEQVDPRGLGQEPSSSGVKSGNITIHRPDDDLNSKEASAGSFIQFGAGSVTW